MGKLKIMIITTLILTLILTGEFHYIMKKGNPLSLKMQNIAAEIGIKNPEKIRMLYQYKIFGMKNILGMTIGNAILIKTGYYTDSLMAHELIHVKQYQDCGGIRNFLAKYICEVIHKGYWDAPCEVEARIKSDLLKDKYTLN